MKGKDKAALIRMAELWDKQAEAAERQEKNNNRRPTS